MDCESSFTAMDQLDSEEEDVILDDPILSSEGEVITITCESAVSEEFCSGNETNTVRPDEEPSSTNQMFHKPWRLRLGV